MSAQYPKIRFQNHLAFQSGSVTTWRLAVVSHDERQAELLSSHSDLSTNECFIPKLYNICVICSAFQLQRAWKTLMQLHKRLLFLLPLCWWGKWRWAWVWLGLLGLSPPRRQGQGQPPEPALNCWGISPNVWNATISDLLKLTRNFLFGILVFFRVVDS